MLSTGSLLGSQAAMYAAYCPIIPSVDATTATIEDAFAPAAASGWFTSMPYNSITMQRNTTAHKQSMHLLLYCAIHPLTMTIVGTSKSQLMECGGFWNKPSSSGATGVREVSVWFTPPIFILILINRLVS